MDNRDFVPTKISRKTAIDFIDSRMAAYHPAFDRPPLRFDSNSGKYVPDSQALVPVSNSASSASDLQVLTSNPPINPPQPIISIAELGIGPDWQFTPRKEITDLQAMNFWAAILPRAMSQLCQNTEPKILSEKRCGIRSKEDWDDIYSTLEAARNKYQQDIKKPLSRVTELRRKAADNLGPVSNFFKNAKDLLPDSPYTTPILGAVDLVLDAAQKAAQVRKEVLESFDNLVDVFSSVELFLSIFPGDQNITNKSISLTVAILEGVERAIAFFHGSAFKRAFKALGTGGDYEKGLRDSIATIPIKSKALMEEATKSSMHKQEMEGQENQQLHQKTSDKLDQAYERIDRLATGFNAMNDLLTVHLERKDRELEMKDRELQYYKGLAHRTPSPLLSSPWPSPPQVQLPSPSYSIDQNTLRHILGSIDIDLSDILLINDRKGQISHGQRAQAEQIVSSALFQQWVVSTCSSKLLVHWDNQTVQSVAGISPLTVFCTTMSQALRSRDRFISVLWFCGIHCDGNDAGDCIGGRAMLASLLDQILRQHLFYTGKLHHEINLNLLQGGQSLNELFQLLGWLVRQLPSTLTLFFIIDGVYVYERDDFWPDTKHVFLAILHLLNDPSVSATIKVLFASAPGTTNVRGAFEAEGLILGVDELPKLGSQPSDERMIREMGVDQADTNSQSSW